MKGRSLYFWLGPGENCALKAFLLPAHRLVGELSHPVELLLHLVFSACTTPTRGKYSALFLPTYRSVLQRGAAQNPGSQRCPSFSLIANERSAKPNLSSHGYIFSNKWCPPFFSSLCRFAPLSAQGCWTNSPRGAHTRARTHRRSSSEENAAVQQCNVGNVVRFNSGILKSNCLHLKRRLFFVLLFVLLFFIFCNYSYNYLK